MSSLGIPPLKAPGKRPIATSKKSLLRITTTRMIAAYVLERRSVFRAHSKITSHFRIPSSGHLWPFLNRKILEIIRLFLWFRSIGITKSDPNLNANSAKLFLSEPLTNGLIKIPQLQVREFFLQQSHHFLHTHRPGSGIRHAIHVHLRVDV